MSAIRELRERVEAGESLKWTEFMPALGLHPDDRVKNAAESYHGSLDAAKALHEAVLPEWVVSEFKIEKLFCAIFLENNDDLSVNGQIYAENQEAARAWLIAILTVLEVNASLKEEL